MIEVIERPYFRISPYIFWLVVGSGCAATRSEPGSAVLSAQPAAASPVTAAGMPTSPAPTANAAPPPKASAVDAVAEKGVRSSKYRCTLVLGLTITAEWFNAGFEQWVEDGAWEARLRPHTFIKDWADPKHVAWQEPITSPCSENPDSPDRVLAFVADWKLPDAAAWKEPLETLIATLHQKFPELRRIDLATVIRAPKNLTCGDPKSVVESFVDGALREAASAHPGLVRVSPALEVPSCDFFEKGGPHFVESRRSAVAQLAAHAYVD